MAPGRLGGDDCVVPGLHPTKAGLALGQGRARIGPRPGSHWAKGCIRRAGVKAGRAELLACGGAHEASHDFQAVRRHMDLKANRIEASQRSAAAPAAHTTSPLKRDTHPTHTTAASAPTACSGRHGSAPPT
jgi:hypothetical protein